MQIKKRKELSVLSSVSNKKGPSAIEQGSALFKGATPAKPLSTPKATEQGEIPVKGVTPARPLPINETTPQKSAPIKGVDLSAKALLKGAKKKEPVNAIDSDNTRFNVEKNESGKWEDVDEARKRYKERLKKRVS